MERDHSGRRLAVLAYHRIGDPSSGPPGLVSATVRGFERQMRALASCAHPVSLADLLAARAGARPLPSRPVAVTFDDAYADFGEQAWPVLRRYGVPVTLFVPTAYPGGPGDGFWWDQLHAAVAGGREPLATPLGRLRLDSEWRRRRAYRALRDHVKSLSHDDGMELVRDLVTRLGRAAPVARILSWEELRRLAAEGVTLAPHTRTHPCLDALPPERLADEVAGSVAELATETGVAARAFAYPSGRVNAAARQAVRDAGLELAFATSPGIARPGRDDPLCLPRICMSRRLSPELSHRRAPRPAADKPPAIAYVM